MHKHSCFMAAVRKGALGWLDTLLKVARKHKFELIEQVLTGLTDDQHKLKEVELLLSRKFRKDLLLEGHRDIVVLLKVFRGVVEADDKRGLSLEKLKADRERYLAFYEMAVAQQQRKAGKVPGHFCSLGGAR